LEDAGIMEKYHQMWTRYDLAIVMGTDGYGIELAQKILKKA
jgi:hypothetical protein